MKIILLKKNLKDGLVSISNAISDNNNLPVLKCLLLKTFNGQLKISATNLELAITTFISGKIIEEGSMVLPFAALNNIVNNTISERIELENKDNNVVVTLDNYEAKIQGLNESDFPIIPKIEKTENYLEIEPKNLQSYLTQVSVAAQVSEIRPELSGVLINFQTDHLKIAATDSFKLSEKTLSVSQFKTNFTNPWKVIIPLKTTQEIIKLLVNATSVRFCVDTNQIFIKTDSSELISHLLDGQYPDYEQIIPQASATELIFEREALIQAIKLVSNFSGKINDIHLRLKGDEKTLEIYAANQFLGENNYLIPVKTKGDTFADITFNWRFLLDGLRILSGKNLTFGLSGDNRPAILRNPEDLSFIYVIMPIKMA